MFGVEVQYQHRESRLLHARIYGSGYQAAWRAAIFVAQSRVYTQTSMRLRDGTRVNAILVVVVVLGRSILKLACWTEMQS